MAKLRYTARVKAAGIDKRDDADCVGDLDARLEAQLQARLTANRVVIDIEWAGFLIRVSAD